MDVDAYLLRTAPVLLGLVRRNRNDSRLGKGWIFSKRACQSQPYMSGKPISNRMMCG